MIIQSKGQLTALSDQKAALPSHPPLHGLPPQSPGYPLCVLWVWLRLPALPCWLAECEGPPRMQGGSTGEQQRRHSQQAGEDSKRGGNRHLHWSPSPLFHHHPGSGSRKTVPSTAHLYSRHFWPTSSTSFLPSAPHLRHCLSRGAIIGAWQSPGRQPHRQWQYFSWKKGNTAWSAASLASEAGAEPRTNRFGHVSQQGSFLSPLRPLMPTPQSCKMFPESVYLSKYSLTMQA